ncbi:MAG: Chromate resistance protein ChrB [Rubrobacteraceae bacterium]
MESEGNRGREWFILVYKLPAEPTRYRASVWRKLRAAGAVYLQNGAAALPADPGGERVMRGIVQEVDEAGGMAHLLRGGTVGDEAGLVRAFGEARDAEYSEVLDRCREFHAELEKERAAGKFTFAELEENEEDLAKLEAWIGKIRARDRFGAPLSTETGRAVEACREDLEKFAASVYEAADHGSAGASGGQP